MCELYGNYNRVDNVQQQPDCL